jgi:hypothetical protein
MSLASAQTRSGEAATVRETSRQGQSAMRILTTLPMTLGANRQINV